MYISTEHNIYISVIGALLHVHLTYIHNLLPVSSFARCINILQASTLSERQQIRASLSLDTMRLDRYAVFQEQRWGCFAKVAEQESMQSHNKAGKARLHELALWERLSIDLIYTMRQDVTDVTNREMRLVFCSAWC